MPTIYNPTPGSVSCHAPQAKLAEPERRKPVFTFDGPRSNPWIVNWVLQYLVSLLRRPGPSTSRTSSVSLPSPLHARSPSPLYNAPSSILAISPPHCPLSATLSPAARITAHGRSHRRYYSFNPDAHSQAILLRYISLVYFIGVAER